READGGDHQLHGAAGVHGHGDAQALPEAQAAPDAADGAAEQLAQAGDHQHHAQHVPAAQRPQVHFHAHDAEENGSQDGHQHRLELLHHLLAHRGHLAEQHAHDEGAEDGVDAYPLGGGGAEEGENQDQDEIGVLALGPADDVLHRHAGERVDHEGGG